MKHVRNRDITEKRNLEKCQRDFLRLTGKLKECDTCDLINSQAMPIPTTSDENKKINQIEERQFVDITEPFPLTTTGKDRYLINYSDMVCQIKHLIK